MTFEELSQKGWRNLNAEERAEFQRLKEKLPAIERQQPSLQSAIEDLIFILSNLCKILAPEIVKNARECGISLDEIKLMHDKVQKLKCLISSEV